MFTLRPLGRAAFAAVPMLFLLGAAPSIASAADREIASTGSDDADCAAAPCATLDYVQQQVQPGDTVRLAAGVYPVGDATFNVDDVTYERTGPGEAKITLASDSYGIRVGGQGITFSNLTVSSTDDTIQGETWAFTYTGSDLTLDTVRVEHTAEGVVPLPDEGLGGVGITVRDSVFTDINGTNIGVAGGHITATNSDFSGGGGIFVKQQATVTATNNVFRGNTAGDGGHGIYVEGGSEGGTVTGNRFSPSLEFGINYGQTIQAANNWWGCNEGLVTDGVENPDCVANNDLPSENAEPHLVLGVSADPNPFLIAGSSTITTSLTSSDPESPFVGGPVGTDVGLVASTGTLDDTLLRLASGSAQTTLRQTVDGSPVVTAFLDNASTVLSLGIVVVPDPATRDITSTGADDGDCVAAPCATLEYTQQQVQPGDTVQLAAGVYPVGDAAFNVDDVTYERYGPGEAKITLPNDSYGVQVSGDDVTFRNLTVSSSDDTIQGDTWGFNYTGSGLTLDHMLLQHLNQGVVGALGGRGITVTNSTFTDINDTDVSVASGHITATDNDFTGDGGIHVPEQATVTATGNVFHGNTAGDGGSGIYVDGGSAGGTVTGNRFSPNLSEGIDGGQAINAANNWWGCNAGIEHRGCVGNYDLPLENAEPHLVLNVTADPNPFVIAGSSTITTSLTSSDPESPFVGGPVGTDVRLVTSTGTLDDTLLRLASGTAQTTLRQTVDGSPVVTAFLDHASAIASLGLVVPGPATREIASTGSDDGDCISSPCATLSYMQERVQAGDTVRIADGVYPIGDARFDVDNVTYEHSGPGEVKVTLPEDSHGFQVGGQGITFRNLTVTSTDDTIQGYSWAFAYHGSDLTLDTMRVEHTAEGVVGTFGGDNAFAGTGITVRNSVFTDITGTAIGVDSGHTTATDNDISSGSGIFVTDRATVTATGNVFRGSSSGGGNGIYMESNSLGGTVSGNRFSPSLEFGINSGQQIDAANNWWGCNAGIEHDGCVDNYDLPPENAEPHLVLDLTADPNPFLTTGFSTLTARLLSSDPESPFVGGPVGTEVALATSAGELDDTQLNLVDGVGQTVLRHGAAGVATVTATLDNASSSTTLEARMPPIAQAITFTSTLPTGAVVGGDFEPVATGGESGNPVIFSVDGSGTAGACTIDDTIVFFTGAGTCTLNANQDADGEYTAAPQVQQTFDIGKGGQAVTFTSTAPSDAVVGGSYTLTATGGNSTQPVTFSVDEASDDACTIDDATVSFIGAGTCTINADQAGDTNYTAAPQKQQSFDIGKAAQTISFTSTTPTDAVVGGTYTLTASGGNSTQPVTFSLDETSGDACTIDDATVSFTGAGTCKVNADQAGDANYTAAEQKQQTVSVAPAPVTSASLSPSSFAYDAVNAGTGTDPQSREFTLTNTGNRDITVQNPTLTGDNRADYVINSNSCDANATLEPDDQCTYVVTFAPLTIDATYDAAATLNVQYVAAALAPGETEIAPATVVTSALSGQVNEAPFAFEAESGQVDLGSATVATATAPRQISFTNTGLRVVRPDAVSMVGQDRGAYTITADTCTNADLAPAGTCSVAVSFTPATVGVTSATLRVGYDAGSGAVNVGLTGTGLAKKEADPITPSDPGTVPVPPAEPLPPTALPLKLNTVRNPARCLTYGATTPKKTIALKTDAKAKVRWAIKKVRGSKALSKCTPAPSVRKYTKTSGKAKGSGAVKTDATGSAKVTLAKLLPARVRKAMTPGLYRITFVAQSSTGYSSERAILIRVLKRQR